MKLVHIEASVTDIQNEAQQSLGVLWETLADMWYGFLKNLPMLFFGVLIIMATVVFVKIFNKFAIKFLTKFHLKGSQVTLITRLSVIAIWVFGLLVALTVIFPNLTPTKALAGLGLGSIAIGFAFKDIFENFFAGILILWRFPFENGDYIVCQGIEGAVVDVTIRNTLIRRPSGELVVMPNATIFKNSVDVLTDKKLRRVSIIAGVAYGEDVDKSRAVIEKAVQNCETVSSKKPVEIFACEFAHSSINFEVAWWTKPTPLDVRKSRDQVVAAVKRALDEAGIEIPFPYRTLTFKEPLKIEKTKLDSNEQQ